MLPFKNRLTKTKEINEVLKKGRIIKNNFFVLRYKKNKKKVSRFCFVVSQKISKKATERNRLKRYLREIIREDLNDIKEGFDVVIFLRKRVLELNFTSFKKSLRDLFKKTLLYDKHAFN